MNLSSNSYQENFIVPLEIRVNCLFICHGPCLFPLRTIFHDWSILLRILEMNFLRVLDISKKIKVTFHRESRITSNFHSAYRRLTESGGNFEYGNFPRRSFGWNEELWAHPRRSVKKCCFWEFTVLIPIARFFKSIFLLLLELERVFVTKIVWIFRIWKFGPDHDVEPHPDDILRRGWYPDKWNPADAIGRVFRPRFCACTQKI